VHGIFHLLKFRLLLLTLLLTFFTLHIYFFYKCTVPIAAVTQFGKPFTTRAFLDEDFATEFVMANSAGYYLEGLLAHVDIISL
jgi:hypothetical protein